MSIKKPLLRIRSVPLLLLVVSSVFAATVRAQPVCVTDLQASPQINGILLTWTPIGADHYNVYRGTASGGPYSLLGSTSGSSFLDTGPLLAAQTYYYVVRPANASDIELCQSNEAQQIFLNIRGVPVASTGGLVVLICGVVLIALLRLRPTVNAGP